MTAGTRWHPLALLLAFSGGLGGGVPAAAAPTAAAAAASQATARAPSAQALRALRAAEQRLAGIGELETRAQAQGVGMPELLRRRDGLRQGRVEALQALQQARGAQAPVAECLAALQRLRDAQLAAVPDWQGAADAARQQVRLLASAAAAELAPALAASERQAAARAAREQGLTRGLEQGRAAAQDCRTAAQRADADAARGLAQQGAWEQGARELAPFSAQLQQQMDALLQALRDASAPLRLRALPAQPNWPGGAAQSALLEALNAAASSNGEAELARIDLRASLDLGAQREALQARIDALARLEDAATYLDLLIDEASRSCPGSACAPLAADRAALQPRLEAARRALQQAVQALAAAEASAGAALNAPAQQLLARQQRLQALEGATAAAADEAQQLEARVTTTLGQAIAALEDARLRAQREHDRAYQAAYGRAPPHSGPMPAAGAASPPPPAPPQLMAAPQLGGHAVELVTQWDAEPNGFGAYTYVLLRSAGDLQHADVQRRWRFLLERVMRERSAGGVAEFEKPSINLIAIPAPSSPDAAGNGQLPYSGELGAQWLLRANAGLLARPEMRRRLVASPGPFLLTLPTRLAQAQASTPLLFADLSRYGDDAVADLVNGYLGSLLIDFPRQQQQWTPPVPQRVALQMIRWASDAGELVLSLVPGAQAAPSR